MRASECSADAATMRRAQILLCLLLLLLGWSAFVLHRLVWHVQAVILLPLGPWLRCAVPMPIHAGDAHTGPRAASSTAKEFRRGRPRRRRHLRLRRLHLCFLLAVRRAAMPWRTRNCRATSSSGVRITSSRALPSAAMPARARSAATAGYGAGTRARAARASRSAGSRRGRSPTRTSTSSTAAAACGAPASSASSLQPSGRRRR